MRANVRDVEDDTQVVGMRVVVALEVDSPEVDSQADAGQGNVPEVDIPADVVQEDDPSPEVVVREDAVLVDVRSQVDVGQADRRRQADFHHRVGCRHRVGCHRRVGRADCHRQVGSRREG